MGPDYRRFIIEILLRAREEISQAAQRAAESLNRVTEAQRSHNEAQAAATQHARAEKSALEDLVRSHTREKTALDEEARSLKALATERRRNADAAKKIVDDLRRQAQLERATSAEREKQQIEEITRLRRLAAAREEQIGKVDREVRAQRRRASTLSAEAAEESAANKRRAAELDLLIAQRRAFAEDAEKEARTTERSYKDIERNANTLGREIGRLENQLSKLGHQQQETERSGNRLLNFFRRGRDDADAMEISMARLGASLRGFQVAFVIKYAQALVSALVALAGTLVSVASSAVQAGVALAAGLAGGAAQALPIVGALFAVLTRVAAVIKAVKLEQQNKLNADHSATTAADQQRTAQERVRDALLSQKDAQRQLTEAIHDRSVALQESKRNLDAVYLAERRSILGVEDAQRALRAAIQTGDASSVAGAQLDLEEARRTRRGAVSDARFARRVGMSRSDAERVRNANNQVISSQRALARATQQVADAHRDAAEAADKQTSAVDRLNAMLEQLSPAERGMYRAILRIQQTVRENVRPITDIIVRSFTRGIDRANELLQDPQVLRGFGRVATTISNTIDRLVDVGSNARSRNLFGFLTGQIQRNGPIVTRILTQIFRILQSVARAAAPAFHDLLVFIQQLVDELENTTSRTKSLSDFFQAGVDDLKAWVRLGQAALDVFFALVGVAAPSGLRAIRDATGWLQGLAQKIRDNKTEIGRFFEEARHGTGEVFRVIVALGQAIISVFSTQNIHTFSDFLVQVLIPALVNVIRFMGFLTSAVHAVLSQPIISDFAVWIGTIAILSRGLAILKGAVTAIGLALGFVRTEGKLTFIGNPWILAITGIVSALQILDGKFHIIKSFTDLFKSSQEKAQEAAEKLTDAIQRQIDALRRQRDAQLSLQGSRLGLQRAEIAVIRARQESDRVEKQIASGELKGRDADIARREARVNLKQAILDEKQARLDLRSAREADTKSDRDAVDQSKKTVDAVKDRIDALLDERNSLKDNVDFAKNNLKAEEDRLKTLTPGTDAYRIALENVKTRQDQLKEAQSRLRDNQRELRTETDKGITAYKRYRLALKRSGDSTSNFGDTVADTMDGVVKDVNQVLIEFGAKPIKFTVHRKRTRQETENFGDVIAGSDLGSFPGRQTGGLVVPGYGDGDKVRLQAAVEPGESLFVLNRTATRTLRMLQRLNSDIPRFQRGGIVPIPGMPGESIDRRILRDVLAIIRRYKALVTDGYAPTGHAAGGEHPLGLAVDLVPGPGGSWDLIDKLAAWAEPSQNNPRYPFRWVGYTGDAGHGRGDHLHLSWLHDGLRTVQTLHGAIGAMAQIARRVVRGPDGALKDMLTGSIGRVRHAGNRFINRALSFNTPSDQPLNELVTGNGSGLMRRIAQQRGWNFSDWWWIDAIETSHGQNLANPSSSARLRGQFLDFNYGKYGPGSDPRQNPTMAQQIRAFAAYIAARYGNPTAARRFHETHGYYRFGGSVPGYGGGDRWPILAEGGEHVWTKEEVMRAGGHGVMRALRRMLGGGGQGGLGRYQLGGNVNVGLGAAPGHGQAGDRSTYLSSALGHILDIFDKLSDDVRKSTDLAGRIRRAFGRVFDEGGYFDQLTQRVENIGIRGQTALQRAQFRVRGGVPFRVNLSDQEIAERQLGTLGRQRGVLEDQSEALSAGLRTARRALAQARRRHNQRAIQQARAEVNRILGLQQQLASTLAQNAQDMVEAQEQAQQGLLDDINKRAGRATGTADALDRLAQLGGQTNFGLVGASLRIRRSALIQQRAGLLSLLGQAQRTGNVDLADELTSQIQDLNVSLAENTQAIKDNTDAAFTERVNRINAAADFSGTVFGGALNFFRTLGQQTGQDTSGIVASLISGQGAALNTQRTGLLGALADLLGIGGKAKTNLLNLQGGDLVKYLVSIASGPALGSILSKLDPTQQQQFKDLVSALLGNTNAVQDNTNQLNEALGITKTQSFSSSWWQRFRMAIFTGGGDLLPTFNFPIPVMDDGLGVATRDGAYFLRAGERVTRPDDGDGGDHYHLHVTSPTEVADPATFGHELAFYRKTRGR